MQQASRIIPASWLSQTAALLCFAGAVANAQPETEQAWIDISLDAQGRVTEAVVQQQPPTVTSDLESWVMATSFDPAVVNAEPVPSTTSVSVEFSPQDDESGDGLKVLAHTTGPRPISIREPKYPHSDRKKRLEGWVQMIVTMNADGEVTNAQVTRSSDESFEHDALKAIKHWTYKMPTVNGRAIGAATEQTIFFRPDQN